MKIASLVLRVSPERFAEAEAFLAAIPGAELHGGVPEQGRLIVTVEDGPDYSMADSLLAVSTAPQVMAATLAYEYTDEGLELPEIQEA